jgi:hypothetical protein
LKWRQEIAGAGIRYGHKIKAANLLAPAEIVACEPSQHRKFTPNSNAHVLGCNMDLCPWCLAVDITFPAFFELKRLMLHESGENNGMYSLAIRRCDIQFEPCQFNVMMASVARQIRRHKESLKGACAIKQIKMIGPAELPANAMPDDVFFVNGTNGYSVRLMDIILLPAEKLTPGLSDDSRKGLHGLRSDLRTISNGEQQHLPYHPESTERAKKNKTKDKTNDVTLLVKSATYSLVRAAEMNLPSAEMQPNLAQLRYILPKAIVPQPTWYTSQPAAVAAMQLQLKFERGEKKIRRVGVNSIQKLAKPEKAQIAREKADSRVKSKYRETLVESQTLLAKYMKKAPALQRIKEAQMAFNKLAKNKPMSHIELKRVLKVSSSSILFVDRLRKLQASEGGDKAVLACVKNLIKQYVPELMEM